MRILVDINHPSQVHLFRGAILEWKNRGHEVLVTARDKDITLKLLELYGIKYRKTGREWSSRLLNLVLGFLQVEYGVLKTAIAFNPDWLLGTSFAIAHASKLVRGRSIVFADDSIEGSRLFWLLVDPFADFVATPDAIPDDHGPHHFKYPSYQKMAYLHPKHFIPDPSIFDDLGLNKGQPFTLLRFVAFHASHDVGHGGIPEDVKVKLLSALTQHGAVFISSEKSLSGPYKKHMLNISPTRIHHVQAFADIVVCESASMTVESAILGTPSVYCSSLVGTLPVIDELEKKYNLAFQFLPSACEDLLNKVSEILNKPDRRNEWSRRRAKMLAEKIDLTDWMVHLLEKLQGQNNTSTTHASFW
jgi:predicted glycosyltransferase